MHARVFWQGVKSVEFESRRIRAKRLCRQRDVIVQRAIATTETCNIAVAATFRFNAASNSRHSPWNFDATRCVDSIDCDVDLVDPSRCIDPTRRLDPTRSTRCVDSTRCDAKLIDPTWCVDPTR